MKSAKKIIAFLLTAIMMLSMCSAVLADVPDGDAAGSAESGTGTITIENATIDETYHLYKLFDVTIGTPYADENGETVTPTAYVATAAQKTALEAANGNVFEFTELSDGTYQVIRGVKTDEAGNFVEYTDADIIAFINTFIGTLSGGVTSCNFPGAVEVNGVGNVGIGTDKAASASTITWNSVPYGYYFVTSSLGSVVSIDTSNPNAVISDKNSDNPDWNNEPDEPEPDGPVKDVQNSSGQSIDGDQVKVGDILTYVISYTNESGTIIDELEITDASPEGTVFDENEHTQKLVILDANGEEVDLDDPEATLLGVDNNGETRTLGGTWSNMKNVDKNCTEFTWNVKNLPNKCTVKVYFEVKVTEDALEIETKTVENEADAKVKIGDNVYDLKTNKVENPVDDPDDPVKDVLNEEGQSINKVKVDVGQILTYKITYTNTYADTEGNEQTLDSLVITDAPPTGTVYVADSAAGTVTAKDDTKTAIAEENITVDADGIITWSLTNVEPGATVDVIFKVKVTEAALTITNKTIENEADVDVTIGENTWNLKTNIVENPVDENPGDPNPGKVIINPDGSQSTTSTGAFGDTVTFDVGVNAVNKVKQDVPVIDANGDETEETQEKIVQVKKYYIYDKLDKGFTLNADSMVITINGKEYKVVADDPSTSDKSTTFTIKNETEEKIGTLFTADINGDTLIAATIDWATQDKETEIWNAIYPDCKIHLTYDAVINDKAVIAGDGNINHVYYDYSTTADTNPKEPDPENPEYPSGKDLNHESEEKSTTTYTYALGIQKISNETGAPLEGAEFTAVDAGGNVIGAVKNTGGTYSYTTDDTKDGYTTSFISDARGQIVIKGVDIGTYRFTETKAPNGYNLLTAPVDITATMTSSTTTVETTEYTETRYFEGIKEDEYSTYTGTVYVKNDEGNFTEAEKPNEWRDELYQLVSTSSDVSESGKIVTSETFDISATILLVTNFSGSELPSTGGMGTTIFYILGAILVLGAGILLAVKRLMNTEK